MPKKLRVPTPVLHKPSGQDVVFLPRPNGTRQMVYLGPHGSSEAAKAYRDALASHLAGKPVATRRSLQVRGSEWPTVGQLVAAYLIHCDNYYVDENGRRSNGVVNIRNAVKPFVALLRDQPTETLTINALVGVRQSIIDDGKCNRRTINSKMLLIRQCLNWGVERRMVPGSVWHEISAMKGLPPGRSGVRESKEVEAVPRKWVDAILPHLQKPLAAAVELQWWCGARPSEILQLTRDRLSFDEDGWRFRPPAHKGRWRGKDRVIVLGPEAQRILTPLLKLDRDAAIISPRDAMADISARKAESRKSKETPSQAARRARNAKKKPAVGEFYDVNSYRKAIHRACDAAEIPRWSPHRLRHAAGTRIYLATKSIEHSRVALGHTDSRMTRRYAVAADSALAAAVMGQHG